MQLDECYKVLGLNTNEDLSAVKRAFHRLAHRFHPDLSGDPSLGTKYRQILQAYQYIKKEKQSHRALERAQKSFSESAARFQAYQSVYHRQQSKTKQKSNQILTKRGQSAAFKKGLLEKAMASIFDFFFGEDDLHQELQNEKRATQKKKNLSPKAEPKKNKPEKLTVDIRV